MRKLKRVTVTWLDAYTIDEWTPLARLRRKPFGVLCRSTGFLVKSTPGGVVVAGTVNGLGKACATLFIPRLWVKSVKYKRHWKKFLGPRGHEPVGGIEN